MSLNFACMAIMVKYVSLVKDKGLGIDDQLTVEQSTAILAEAMTIAGRFHTTKISLNMPVNNFVGDLMGDSKYRVHITKCCAGLTESLMLAGYSLDIGDNGMLVYKIG
ncbi:MAG: hypothetical protein IJD72_01490 [Alistipes sp.]|nr:hypothetical protein [Alistipes sp.]